jgi:hypothetical protein
VVALGGWHAAQAASADEVPMNTPNRPDGWIRGCTGKSRFTSHGEAARRARIMRQKKGLPMQAYHCKHCRHFHVGTSDGYESRHQRAQRRNQEDV